ncbi:hypothetical protein [Roseibium marinum]|uniref:Uncharacterized protein n=1 Tax=Roseibium marinum TaxID=281252 RepID=A0A2S3UUX1_9HYPH|nr:hypothetical protein [Roseibium marinum]POF31521.1 hypothetical protein CLV41_10485 [Roseibium marinum]
MKTFFTTSFLAVSLLSNVAGAETVEKWNSGEVNGFTRFWTTNNEGSNFVVWCHPQRKVNGTLLHIVIAGDTPPPDTRVKLILDREVLDLPVNKQGYIDSGCATCADSFDYVWHKLRSSRSLAVKFQDERYAGFSLRGARQIIPGSVCPTDWDKRKPSS